MRAKKHSEKHSKTLYDFPSLKWRGAIDGDDLPGTRSTQ